MITGAYRNMPAIITVTPNLLTDEARDMIALMGRNPNDEYFVVAYANKFHPKPDIRLVSRETGKDEKWRLSTTGLNEYNVLDGADGAQFLNLAARRFWHKCSREKLEPHQNPVPYVPISPSAPLWAEWRQWAEGRERHRATEAKTSGRPPLPPEQRTVNRQIAMTPGEWEYCRTAGKEAGTSASEYIKSLIHNDRQSRACAEMDQAEKEN